MLPPSALTVAGLVGEWDICQVYTSHEKALAWQLLDAGVGYFLPLNEVRRRSGDRDRRRVLPVIPGYVFLCNSDHGRARDLMLKRHARSILRFIDVRYPDQLITELAQVHAAIVDRKILDPCKLKPGERCRVVDGPFMGTIGEFDSERRRGWVWLNVHTLGQPVPIEIETNCLEPLCPDGESQR